MPREEPYNTERARELRKQQSPPEGVLWSKLRDRRLGGFKFRRQHSIGPIVVDFCCPDAMLVVELDSDWHIDTGPEDAARDRLLADRGYETVRVTARDFTKDQDAVLQFILRKAKNRLEK